MGVITYELEISSSVPAPKLFKAFNDYDNVAPKVDPQTYKSIEIIKGDGGPGTIKHATFADGMPFKGGKSKVDLVDSNNFALSYTVFEGDVLMGILDSATHHLKFIPSADGGSVYKHTVVYNIKGDSSQISEENINQAKESLTKTFKAFEAHVNANPGAY